MTIQQSNNKRIAKNTMFLYIRLFLVMSISFYTSRVILNALGVIDYGLYNVVGGIIVMFGLLNSSMATATQRFLTFETGKNDKDRLKTIFGISLSIHILIAIIVVILGETIGMWFFLNKLNIPTLRFDAAMWVFQCSILSAIVMIISVPYNAVIIAHEEMSAFAYISILEVILKLFSVYLLFVIDADRLKVYAVLMLFTQILLRFIYGKYCHKHFVETRSKFCFEKQIFKEMLSFAAWSIWGNCAVLFCSQGVNLLLNIFFSPAVNAARAIAVQVQSGVCQFSNNLQSAINPQIIKSYAMGEFEYMMALIYRSSKFSFLLLWIIVLPVIMNTNMILKIWLGMIPDYSCVFLRIMLLTILVEVLSNPLSTAVSATGKIKKYQFVVGCIMMGTLPVSYLLLELGAYPTSVFVVSAIFSFVAYVTRLFFVYQFVNIKITLYVKLVIVRILTVVGISSMICCGVSGLFNDSAINVIISCLIYATVSAIVSFVIGFNGQEQQFVILRLTTIVKKL